MQNCKSQNVKTCYQCTESDEDPITLPGPIQVSTDPYNLASEDEEQELSEEEEEIPAYVKKGSASLPRIESSAVEQHMCASCYRCVCCNETDPHPKDHSKCPEFLTTRGIPSVHHLSRFNSMDVSKYAPLTAPTSYLCGTDARKKRVVAFMQHIRPENSFGLKAGISSVCICAACTPGFNSPSATHGLKLFLQLVDIPIAP